MLLMVMFGSSASMCSEWLRPTGQAHASRLRRNKRDGRGEQLVMRLYRRIIREVVSTLTPHERSDLVLLLTGKQCTWVKCKVETHAPGKDH